MDSPLWCDRRLQDKLVWLVQEEVGLHTRPAASTLYDEKYFRNYVKLGMTEIGAKLVAARIDLANRHCGNGHVLDFGSGSGRFVVERNKRGCDTTGYDIMPPAVAWLQENGYYENPYEADVPAITFWDSLEHLEQPEEIIKRAQEWVFISMPIYRDAQHILTSKHYKPGEHLIYWTHNGLIKWMKKQGFGLEEQNDMERELGREDITSFAFRRCRQ